MFSLALDYNTGTYVHLAVLGVVLLIYVFNIIYCLGYNFTTDKDMLNGKMPFIIFGRGNAYNDGADIFSSFGAVFIIGCFLSYVWPAIYPISVVAAALYGLRKWFRFKKKMSELLDNKANKDHTH